MTFLYKLSALLLLFFGEFLAIYAEMTGARLPSFAGAPTASLMKIFGGIFLGSLGLLFGYYYCYKAFQNIWIVTAISITSILLVEPALAYIFFHEIPTRGAMVGLILGAAGLIATVAL